jgi:hypothetical protein
MPNRHIPCIDCGEAKWLSQNQFRVKVAEEGSPKKVKRRFRCKKCKKLEREDPLIYQLQYGKHIKRIKADVRRELSAFYTTNDVNKLRKGVDTIFIKNGIDPMKILFHKSVSGNGKLIGITVTEFPFIGELYIAIYTERKIDKHT